MTRVIVVGAGLAGSSAAWRLAQQGHEVVLLERTTPAGPLGSSHGSARIFRYAYPERLYVDLVRSAAKGWDELASAHGAALITPTGAVDFGALRDPASLAAVLGEAGVEHELLSAERARERWDLSFDTEVLWHPGAGVIDAERAVAAMLDQARMHGAEVLTGWPVTRVERAGAGYRVLGEGGRSVEAEQVVVAAGGWLPDLLASLGLPEGFLAAFPALEVRQEQAYHFPYRDAGEEWPTFIYKAPDIQLYGLPGGRDAAGRGLKVAEFNGGRRIPSASAQHEDMDAGNRERVVEFVRAFLPALDPTPYAETTCLFTNTPTEDFVIDRAEGITILSPCSGHGAKFAPLLGELAATLVAGRDAVPEVFRPSLAAG